MATAICCCCCWWVCSGIVSACSACLPQVCSYASRKAETPLDPQLFPPQASEHTAQRQMDTETIQRLENVRDELVRKGRGEPRGWGWGGGSFH